MGEMSHGISDRERRRARLISVVLPAYREASGIERMLAVLEATLSGMRADFEVIVVDDGSPDNTFSAVVELGRLRPWLRGLRLSRNFGKEAALLAGLEEARGDVVITMDADLQHPPETIPAMLAAWEQGADVVNAVKSDRSTDNRAYALLAGMVTRLLARATGIDLHAASDFKLLDRRVVRILVDGLPERERFFRGLSKWVGFRQLAIPFRVAASTRTERNWSLSSLGRLAATALVSFTSAPLQVITVLGVLTLVLAIGVGAEGLWSWVEGRAVSGFTTLILTLLILGSFIMISLGILGSYVARIYEEIKQRPRYLVSDYSGEVPNHRTGREHAVGAAPRRAGMPSVPSKRPHVIGGEVHKKHHGGHGQLRSKIGRC